MKKEKIKKLFLLILITISACLCLNLNAVKADSGWDTSYGGGSSWSSSSSSSSSRSSSKNKSSSHTASASDTLLAIVGVILGWAYFALIIIIIYNYDPNKKRKRELPSEKIKELDSNLDIEDFNKKAYSLFVDVQNGWMNFDYELLRSKLSDELFNTYSMQLETLKTKGQKNIMEDFKYIKSNITNISIKNNIEEITLYLNVTFRDYVADGDNNVVRGDKNKVYNMHYLLTFIKTVKTKDNKCPKCGNKLKNTASSKCEFCGSTIVADSYEYVLSKKELIEQK